MKTTPVAAAFAAGRTVQASSLYRLAFTFLFTFFLYPSFAQMGAPCPGHPLFSPMLNHSVRGCEEKDFDQLTLYRKDPAQGRVEISKQGHKNGVQYKFEGDWNKRPSTVQIVQNYVGAIQKGGGEVLYQSDNYVSGKIKKSDGVYWVTVSSDGSGDYTLYSVREEAMKQDVVLTAEEIKNGIRTEGKAVFYGIYFDTDKATLKSESAPALEEMARYLKANPSVQVYIVGHTDNTGDFARNTALSKSRAEAVVAALSGTYGVGKDQLSAQGAGPLAPVASNESAEGKAKNRRVEMVKR